MYVHSYLYTCVYIYIYMYFQEKQLCVFFIFFKKRLNTKENMHDYGKGGVYFYLVVVMILQKSGEDHIVQAWEVKHSTT